MAKRIHRKLTPAELKRVRRDRQLLQAEKNEIIEKGRRFLERHERLLDALRNLKDEREAQGVSLGELERRTGIKKSTLSRLENDANANPTISTLMRIAEALGREITIQLTNPKHAA